MASDDREHGGELDEDLIEGPRLDGVDKPRSYGHPFAGEHHLITESLLVQGHDSVSLSA